MRGSPINTFLWFAVGLLAGAMAAGVMPAPGWASRVENVLVAIFGAFIGGDFLASQFSGGASADGVFRASSLGLAIAGAVLMLFLLALMRRHVGPMRPHKLPRRRRP